MANLIDSSTPSGRRVSDQEVTKHVINGLQGERNHLLKKQAQELLLYSFKDVLPQVRGDDDAGEISTKWTFTLKPGGSTKEVFRGATPMRSWQKIPEGCFEDLEEGCTDLERRLQDRKVAGTSRSILESFLLPDPDEAPEAYRLYGPPWARKMTVLWGLDRPGTKSIAPGAAIAKLKARQMPAIVTKSLWFGIIPLLCLSLLIGGIITVPKAIDSLAERKHRSAIASVESTLNSDYEDLIKKLGELDKRSRETCNSVIEVSTELNGFHEEAKKVVESGIGSISVIQARVAPGASIPRQADELGTKNGSETAQLKTLAAEHREISENLDKKLKALPSGYSGTATLVERQNEALTTVSDLLGEIGENVKKQEKELVSSQEMIEALRKFETGSDPQSLAAMALANTVSKMKENGGAFHSITQNFQTYSASPEGLSKKAIGRGIQNTIVSSGILGDVISKVKEVEDSGAMKEAIASRLQEKSNIDVKKIVEEANELVAKVVEIQSAIDGE